MEDLLKKLTEIENSLVSIGDVIRYQRMVCSAELEDRQRLGLRGSDAIKHFNEWMTRFGLTNFVV